MCDRLSRPRGEDREENLEKQSKKSNGFLFDYIESFVADSVIS